MNPAEPALTAAEEDRARAISRREVLAGMVGLTAAAVAGGCAPVAGAPSTAAAPASGPMFAYVGGYTSKERNGHAEGISVYRVDPGSGAWTSIQVLRDLVNPSFLTLDHQRQFLYSAHGDGTEAIAYAIDKQTGQLRLLNRQPTGGKNGVRLIVDPSNRFVVVANYSSGSVTVLPINRDGSLAPHSDLVALSGKTGPHRTRQEASHPHDTLFDRGGRFLLVPDLGLDRVFVFKLDGATGKLVANDPPSVAARSGAGPRHVDFHPTKPCAYVINELDSTITTYRFDGERGALTPLQVSPTLPPAFTGESTASEVAVAASGRWVYGSNRGYDSIAIFGVDEAGGTLTTVGWELTQGKTPRFFAPDPSGAVLYAANQDSDTIVTFRVDGATGKLTPTGQVIKTGSPSSIVFR
jgi:6-phosphogluconolactonase